ncbi:MAG TPA: anti-sigma-D factor RsdA [Mycobacterium sp.]|nr:anti-sigma-D factor RsdA [Mycobacterium sp.]
MPDFGRWNNGGDPSLNEINRTDRFLDALANQQPVYSTDPGEAELAQLLSGWRDEIRTPPLMRPVTPRDAAAALTRAVDSRKRTRMSFAIVGSVAAAVLCIGGFGAVIANSGPGDSLYGLRTALFGEQTRTDQVTLASQQLAEVQQLIDEGQWQEAQDKLQAVTTTVATVNDVEQKQELVTQWQQLTVKVDAKDASATLPPGAPPPPMPEPPVVVAPGSATSTTETSTDTSGSTSPSQPPTSTTETTSSVTVTTSTPTSSSQVPEPPPSSGTPTTTTTTPPTSTSTTTTTTTTHAVTTTTTTPPAPPPPPIVGPSAAGGGAPPAGDGGGSPVGGGAQVVAPPTVPSEVPRQRPPENPAPQNPAPQNPVTQSPATQNPVVESPPVVIAPATTTTIEMPPPKKRGDGE